MMAAIAVICFAVGHAAAAVLLYSDQTSFDAVTTTSVFTDFEGLTSTQIVGNPIVVDGVSYQSDSQVVVCTAVLGCSGSPYDSSVLFANFGDPLEIDTGGLGFDVTAVGGFFGDLDSGPSDATIYLYGLEDALLASFVVEVLDMGAGLEHSFFGFTTTNGDVITRIVFDMNGWWETVDNMQFGTVSAVPLPAALPLFLTVLAGMGALRWWRKRQVA
jgi:hypothetical protein